MRSVLLNQKGSAHYIALMFVVILVLFIPFIAFLVDAWYINHLDQHVTEIVSDLNKETYTMLDVSRTAFRTDFAFLNEATARSRFEESLKSRLHLNDSFEPTANSPASGTVYINQYTIVNPEDLPYSDGEGRTMEFPGVITDIEFDIKTPIFGVESRKRILVTTEIYR